MPKLRRAMAWFIDFALVLAVLTFHRVPALVNALPVLLPGHRSLADRVAGTAVTGFGLRRGAAVPAPAPGATPAP
ncbi:hypothetical protein ACFV5G_39325 [Streptomyces sp. NPDC059766]|uniref:hypothetical protein n=1 Tax=Streptomyces sp. NPDC059766 TaxID=3346940 RepID=UPI00364DBC90